MISTLRGLRSLLLACSVLGLFAGRSCAEEPGLDAELAKARAATGIEAVELYRALTTKHPGSAVAWFEAGDALYDTQAWQEALHAYQQAAQLGSQPARVQPRIGKCLKKLKRYAESEAAFRRALEADPQAPAAQFGLAETLFYQDKLAAAVPVFEALVKRPDEWGEVAREYLARCYYDTGAFAAALAAARELLAKTPADPAFNWLAGRALYKLRRYDEALPHFRKVAECDPKRAEAAHYYVAACLEGSGRGREAEEVYREHSRGSSVWADASRSGAGRLAGPAFHCMLDYAGGYDSNVVRNNPDATPAGQKDSFSEVFADVQGRVLRTPGLNIWLGAEHYGLYYPKLQSNNYMQNAAKAAFNIPHVGPFNVVSVRYQLNYSLLDASAYRREHHVESAAVYQTTTDRLIVGLYYGDNRYFGPYKDVGGPETGASLDYRHTLPGWEHELRLRLNTELRFSHLDTEQRVVERVRLQYRSQIAKGLFGQLEAQYRHADYPHSEVTSADGGLFSRRTDDRWSGEVQFDWQVHRHVFINWGYVFEVQHSTRELERYKRHQGTVGFTVLF